MDLACFPLRYALYYFLVFKSLIKYCIFSKSEKLKQELESNRRDLAFQVNKFEAEKTLFEKQLQSLNKENQELALKVTEINQSKQEQLEASKSSLENISREFQLVRQEKEELQGSFGLFQTELQKEQHLYQQLKQRAEETLRSEHQHVESLLIQLKEADSQKKLLEQRVQQVCQEKLKLVQQSDQQILELKKNIDQMQSDFKQEIEYIEYHV